MASPTSPLTASINVSDNVGCAWITFLISPILSFLEISKSTLMD